MPEHESELLPAWAVRALREPVDSSEAARRRIMQRVRQTPVERSIPAPMRASRWTRRGLLTPVGSALAALMLLFVGTMRIGESNVLAGTIETSVRVVTDTVLPRIAPRANHVAIRDSIFDTLRVVEFMLRAPATVHAAAVTGDFNGWGANRTRMTAVSSGLWSARVVVPRGVQRFAFLVNGDQYIPASPLPADSIGT